jgi:hypothetical protein
MVNIWDVFFNALWILGLAVVLAVWSYARYTAHGHGIRIRDKLNMLKYALALNGGLLLFLSGMALTEDRWFAIILWVLVGAGVIVDSVIRIRKSNMGNTEDNG